MGGGDMPDDGADSTDGVGEEVKVNIRSVNGAKFSVQVNLNSTVEDFKSIVAQKCENPAEKQRLIYRGRILKDDQTLKSNGLQTDDTVYLVRGFATAAPADIITTTDAGTQNTNSTSTNAGSSEGGPRRQWPPFGAGFFPKFAPAPNTNPLPNPWASAANCRIHTKLCARAGRTQTNSHARINPIGNAMPDSPGGLGFPNLEQMRRYAPELRAFIRFMQNPVISQMMRDIISNLQYTEQILASNPQLQNTLAFNPELIRQLASSGTMQRPLNYRAALPFLIGPQTSRERAQNDGGTGGGTNSASRPQDTVAREELYAQNDGGTGGGTNSASRAQDTVAPEELYAAQLSRLQGMGFLDHEENIRALTECAGDVEAAVESLLDNL